MSDRPPVHDEPSARRDAPPRSTARRMAPEDRKSALIEKATEFFSEEGFDAGTRELARQLGITQPLIYRYFASKDDLINEVYHKVYIDQWQDAWVALLCDRSLPMRARLKSFYRSYTATIFNRRWMRIFFFAALKGLDINARYIERVRRSLLVPICLEMRVELGGSEAAPVTEAELEHVWLMHGMIFYQGIRKHVYCAAQEIDFETAIDTGVDMYVDLAQKSGGPTRD